MKFRVLVTAIYLLSMPAWSSSVDEQIESLRPVIGGYPPAIETKEQLATVVASYEKVKSELDSLIAKNPNDLALLFKRGSLQQMGHNMDYKKAWNGAENDFVAILNKDPAQVQAILALATLYINSNIELAPKAELLFRAAQCYSDPTPNESAQSGLFFAYYYQGNIALAYRQAALLKKLWPNNGYEELFNMAGDVLNRRNESLPDTSTLVAASCDKSAESLAL